MLTLYNNIIIYIYIYIYIFFFLCGAYFGPKITQSFILKKYINQINKIWFFENVVILYNYSMYVKKYLIGTVWHNKNISNRPFMTFRIITFHQIGKNN